jgi:hypothetical protein
LDKEAISYLEGKVEGEPKVQTKGGGGEHHKGVIREFNMRYDAPPGETSAVTYM